FFQAEDGIRDFHVTGVQTCALPISRQLARFRAGLVLPQDPDDLLFRKSRSFHSVRPFKGRTLAPRGGNSQGHVTGRLPWVESKKIGRASCRDRGKSVR